MSNLLLIPTKLRGTVSVPPSKSIAHRTVICETLAGKQPSVVWKNEISEDISATAEGIWNLYQGKQKVDCNESGSTLRFLLPLSLVLGNQGHFTGSGALGVRPLAPYFPLFQQCGIQWKFGSGANLDLTVQGMLKPGNYTIDGSVSSQFITGLLFALPLLEAGSQILVKGKMQSTPYIDMTCHVLERYGIKIERTSENIFFVDGNQRYRLSSGPKDVEGDYSQAAFFLGANAMGSLIQIKNLPRDSIQGDQHIIRLLSEMKECQRTGKTFVADGSQCPDIIPILAAVCCFQQGLSSEIIHAERLRLKESDRICAVTSEMQKLGADIAERHDGFRISGKAVLQGGCTVSSHRDHRIAMMLAVASTGCKNPVLLQNPECVTKSYPGFWDDFESLGGKIHERNLGK